MIGRPVHARAAALALAGAALLGPASAAPRVAKPPERSPQQLAIANAVLAKRLELAKGKDFYLLLDVKAPTLTLMLRGAALYTYSVKELEVGHPRVAYVGRGNRDNWQGRIWTKGTLRPDRQRERLEVVATPGMSTEEAEARVPPTPEQIYEVPPRRFLVRFEEGLSLDVRPVGVAASGWRSWLADLGNAILPTADSVRLRVVLAKEDFDALYRSLPPDVKLMVLPPS